MGRSEPRQRFWLQSINVYIYNFMIINQCFSFLLLYKQSVHLYVKVLFRYFVKINK